MFSRRTALTALLSGLSVLCGCATTALDYVEESPGYRVTKGHVRKVENLSADAFEKLGDGVTHTVSEPGCKVTLQMGPETRVLDLGPGSILVLGDKADYVLEPYAAPKK